jgi:hypothetical protein
MFIKVPVFYSESVRLTKRHKYAEMNFAEWVEVNVVEVSDAAAPVATRWDVTGLRATRDYLNGVGETRWFAGRHFVPALHTTASDDAEHIDLGRLLVDCERGHTYSNPLAAGMEWQHRALVEGKARSLAEMPHFSCETYNRGEAIEAAHRRASDVLLIQGKVWVAGHEPVYKVSPSTSFSGRYAYVDVVGVNSLDRLTALDSVFAADQHEDMEECVRRLQEEGYQVGEVPRIDVLDPESILYDAETPAFLEGARTVLEWGKSRLDERSRKEILAGVELRDALHDTAKVDRRPKVLARIEKALDAFGDAVREEHGINGRDRRDLELIERVLGRRRNAQRSPGHDAPSPMGYR